jgi:acetoin utilization deacetylase AcuC-like enzyme
MDYIKGKYYWILAMRIIYSRKFEDRYHSNPAENPDRVRLSAIELRNYEFVETDSACIEDIRRVHGFEHVKNVKNSGTFKAAALAAGGAISAAELAMEGEPAFALIRPPGHHAAANRAWGMCYFNNMAIAVQKIRPKAKRVLIIDIDLHFGDGTVSIFRGDHNVRVVNPGSVDANFDYLTMDSKGYLRQVEAAFQMHDYDIIGVSAGFDTYIEDWGGLLATEDYETIGRIIADGSKECNGRRFAILEGGYHSDLGKNIMSFIKGFDNKI